MRPGVSLQLVAACETFPAENPVADERPLAGVQPDVSSEQRRFPERLLAAGDVTDVLSLPHLPGPAERPHKHTQSDIQASFTQDTQYLRRIKVCILLGK